ncbi:MAG: tetratricopeptide repeat protein [Bacteroidales bacterium]|jgi:tetratricopeptide (TPR) repeat protein|nr:tetratricopeptide repeat protein [Bacteroidales bacterium]NLH23043.1 tetratricopeptide repeat protein [Bacteroidales bacterium]HPJ82539.1 tetratricopeptide repeat protein [Bacteroidales bacterium]
MAKRLRLHIFLLILVFITAGKAQAQYDKQQFFYRGQHLLFEGRYQQAIDNFNKLIQLDPNLHEAYFFRGIGKYNLGDFLGARADFDKALSIHPIFTLAYHYRAITNSRLGDYENALADLQEAIDLRPGYNGLYFSRGVTYLLSQQFKLAEEDFNRFIRHEPRVSEAYLNRGACYLYLKDTVKALRDYDTAVLLNKFDPEGYIRRSRVYAMQENYTAALADLDQALSLDPDNSFAYFNRALIRFNQNDLTGALQDLERVLEEDPGNALTLYNRALIRTQIGDYNNALSDYDRVISINPNNVLAYYNRGALFIQMERYSDALRDYDKAIELYPDFANAYMNRSYVKNRMGLFAAAEVDYKTAQGKVNEYKSQLGDTTYSAFADTTQRFDRLLALDADFAKKDFNNELLQYRDVDIRLKPLFKLLTGPSDNVLALEQRYYYEALEKFLLNQAIPVNLVSEEPVVDPEQLDFLREQIRTLLRQSGNPADLYFISGIIDFQSKLFNASLSSYNQAISNNPDNVFYYINRAALQSEMIEFISSMESNVQILTLDESGTTRTRVQEQGRREYDYSGAIDDLEKAAMLAPDFAHVYYNLGNLYCLSGDFPKSIGNYTRSIELYPYLAEAYYNRGLIQIYLKEKEKGCMDISTAGELGIKDAYSVIKKFCVTE